MSKKRPKPKSKTKNHTRKPNSKEGNQEDKAGKQHQAAQPSSSSVAGESGSSKRFPKLLLAACLITVLLGVGYVVNSNRHNGDSPKGPSAVQDQLSLTRVALAEMENLETESAKEKWDQLHQQAPQNASISLNRALNLTLHVDTLTATATDSLDAAEQKSARSVLPQALSDARASIEDFGKTSQDEITSLWLNTRIDLHEASLLRGTLTRSLRRDALARLTKAIHGPIGREPQSMILGGPLLQVLEQLEDPVSGLPTDLLNDAAAAVGTLSNRHPDNLFFALQAARLNLETKDPQSADYIRRAAELTSAIQPSIAVETKKLGLTPQEFVGQIIQAIESEDWSSAGTRYRTWFNVLNSNEIVKTDRRRASPHPLDCLSFDSLRELSAQAAADAAIKPGKIGIQFSTAQLAPDQEASFIQTIDFDVDFDPDLATIDAAGNIQLWENENPGWRSAGTLPLGMEPNGLISADLFVVDSSDAGRLRADRSGSKKKGVSQTTRHDTIMHLIAYGETGVQIIRVDGRSSSSDDSRLSVVTGDTGLRDLRGVVAMVAGDLEADGDLDLVVATQSDGVRFFVNRGNRTFFELPGFQSPDQKTAFGVDDPVSALAIADLDRDLDLDLVTTHAASGRVGILENLLHLQFRGRFIDEIAPVAGAASISVQDVDGNVSWDLVIGGTSSASIAFSHTADAGVWRVDHVESSPQGATNFLIEDFDNDSWMDVVTQGQVSSIGPWGWGGWKPLDSIDTAPSAIAVDFDGDGGIDIASADGNRAQVFTNNTPQRGHYIDLRFKGIDDNASGRVNHYAIGSVLETRFGPHYRARIVTSPSTHFGLDGLEQANSVRTIFPNGLTQSIREPQIDTTIEEEQTLKGSCPYLYAWDGEKYAFVTDCLWAAPLGLQVAHGVTAKDRPWEYLKLDGRQIRPKDGHYDFRITEELWEVAYFDEIQLTVVDHPQEVDIWTNEKVGPGNIATPTIFSFAQQDRHPVARAVDTAGDDVTSKLKNIDQDFVQGFDRRLRQGLCPPHWIDLEFDQQEAPSDASVYLVLTGWILPTDASLNIQIDQNPDLSPIEFPSVWVPNPTDPDQWKNAIPYMGFPGGKTKTIVVDVTDAMVPEDPRFRIRTSAQIYWDSAEMVVQSSPAEIRTQPAPLVSANIGFHGFSRRVKTSPLHPEGYDYHDASDSARWPPLRGNLSRMGDCLDVVRHWDDRMAVISGGDEIQLRFSVPENPPPEGWTRDFVLHSVGWDKDADLNTITGQQIGPLPYRNMKEYPPGSGQWEASRRIDQINQEHLSRSQTFRSFWFPQTEAPAMRFTH